MSQKSLELSEQALRLGMALAALALAAVLAVPKAPFSQPAPKPSLVLEW
jgi:hypothetical protein